MDNIKKNTCVRKCKWCGSEFTTTNSSHRMFCSDYCGDAAHSSFRQTGIKGMTKDEYKAYKERVNSSHKCEWCGKTFHSTANNAKFCSTHCLRRSRMAKTAMKTKGDVTEKMYEEHQKSIIAAHTKSVRTENGKTIATVVCEHCGKTFEYTLTQFLQFRKYCSRRCKVEEMMKNRRKRERDFAEGNGDAIRKRQYIKERLRYIETKDSKNRDADYKSLLERFPDKKTVRLVEASRKNAAKYDSLRVKFKGSRAELRRLWIFNSHNCDALKKFNKANANAKLKEKTELKERREIERRKEKEERVAHSAEQRRAAYEKWREKNADAIEEKRKKTLERKAAKKTRALERRTRTVAELASKREKLISRLKKLGCKISYSKCEQCGKDIPYVSECPPKVPRSLLNGARMKKFCNNYCSSDYVTEHGRDSLSKGSQLVQIKTVTRGNMFYGNSSQVRYDTVKQKNVERFLMGQTWLSENDDQEDEEKLIKSFADRADRLSEDLNAI